ASSPQPPAPVPSRQTLTPARLLVGAYPERDLADDLVGQRGVGRVEASGTGVAEQAFELALLEHAEAARQVERQVGDLECVADRVMLHRHQLQEPVGSGAAV